MNVSNFFTKFKKTKSQDPNKVPFRPFIDWQWMLLGIVACALLATGISAALFFSYADPAPQSTEGVAIITIKEKELEDVLAQYAARALEFEALKRERPRFIEP